MEIRVSAIQTMILYQGLANLRGYLANLRQQVSNAVGYDAGVPHQIADLDAALADLQNPLGVAANNKQPVNLDQSHAPVLAAVVARHRREFLTELERNRRRAVSRELVTPLNDRAAQLDALLREPWYDAAKPPRIPKLRDFVAPDSRPAEARQEPERSRDDKFGILWSASAILDDLRRTRIECEERSAPLTIAFLDVDGLKSLNSTLGETGVDAFVLPPIMRAIEQVVFGHGLAYRYGGDEFVALIPSADQDVAVAILGRLGDLLARIEYELEIKPPTVSIGLCVLLPDCPLTDAEALHWAAMAKRHAKDAGRNAISLVLATVRINDPRAPTPELVRQVAV